jgi:hypothetical protein
MGEFKFYETYTLYIFRFILYAKFRPFIFKGGMKKNQDQ